MLLPRVLVLALVLVIYTTAAGRGDAADDDAIEGNIKCC